MLKEYLERAQKLEFAILLYVGFFLVSNFAGVSFFSEIGWAPYTTSNSNAPQGAMWVEDDSIHWADGSTEYYIHSDNMYTVDTSSPGALGSVWVEGAYIHWVDQNGYEQRYAGSDTGNNVGNPGDVWLENNVIHYVDENGNERAMDTIY